MQNSKKSDFLLMQISYPYIVQNNVPKFLENCSSFLSYAPKYVRNCGVTRVGDTTGGRGGGTN